MQGIAEAGQDKAEAADKTVKVGCYVKITGLKNRPELNDIVGVVLQIEDGSAVVATQVLLCSCICSARAKSTEKCDIICRASKGRAKCGS